jgi:plastocyanin
MQQRNLAAIVALIALVAVAACGGGGGDDAAPAPDTSAPAATAPDLSDAGGISGTVMLVGDAPAPELIQMAADPFCQLAHSDTVMTSPVMADAGGGLMNVVVHVASGLDGYTFPAASGTATIGQQGCIYSPHVVALRAGQMLKILNDDDTLHNVNVQPSDNAAFNQAQPLAGMTIEKVFDNAEVGIPARCDVHPWMSAFINVFDHPYFAVSSADGSFSIENLPPGDYVIEAWHEALGTQTQSITVAPNETATAGISFGG